MTALQRFLSVIKKYGLFLFIPLLLAAAYFYADSLYPKYKVSAKVEVQDVPAASIIDGIKSKSLVEKTISQLPLTAKFYNVNSPKKELYGDSVPGRFVFSGDNKVNFPTRLEIAVPGGNQFTLNNNDTITFHQFNELINEPYGKFIVEKNPLFKSPDQAFIVKLDEPGNVVDQFYKDLHVESGSQNNVMTVSILAGNSQEGVDFLNMLFRLYDRANPRKAVAAPPVAAEANTDAITNNINTLKEKGFELESEIKKLKEQSRYTVIRPQTRRKLDEKQVKIYEAIKPYVKKPIDQFVQIPFVDEIEDPELNDEVNEYNETELSKQHMLASTQNNTGKIDTTNKKLMMLRSDIFEKVSGFIRGGSPGTTTVTVVNPAAAPAIRAKEDSLNQVYRDIRSERNRVAIVKAAPVKPYIAVSGSRLVMIGKPEDSVEYIPVNEMLIYGLALVASAIILFAWFIIRKVSKRTMAYPSLDPNNISEKINNLFAEKQID
ncbi:MAG: hypothetical protein ACHQHN_10830 [Sphingobacteriales bacterium]